MQELNNNIREKLENSGFKTIDGHNYNKKDNSKTEQNNQKITLAETLGDNTIDLTNSLGKEIKKCDSQVDLKLKRFIENIERLEDEKKELSRQVRNIFKEAKIFGFKIKAMQEILKKRKIEFDERVELERLIETYKEALGMLS